MQYASKIAFNHPSWTHAERKALDDLHTQARLKRLFFFHGGLSGPLWFSPKQMIELQSNGRFIWSAENWRLRDPNERIAEINNEITAKQRELFAFAALMTEPTCFA